jgi:hypothetical protein
MRIFSALLLLSLTAVGCTPFIPVKDDFGTSALAPAGDIPPEFAEFNFYNPGINTLLADQICATPHIMLEDKSIGAVPGRLVQVRARCQTHIPLLGE